MREKEVKCFPITDTYTRRTKSVFSIIENKSWENGLFFSISSFVSYSIFFFIFLLSTFFFLLSFLFFFFLSFRSFFFSVERSMKIGTPFSHRAFLVSDFEYLFSGRSFRNLEIRNSRSTKNSTQWTTYWYKGIVRMGNNLGFSIKEITFLSWPILGEETCSRHEFIFIFSRNTIETLDELFVRR